MKTTKLSYVGEWYVHWVGPGYPKKWMSSDDPNVFVRMHVYPESSGNGLDARLESLGLGEDWGMYGQFDPATGLWNGRWWAAPLLNDSTPNNRWGEFRFTLAADGKTFTGEWTNKGLHPDKWYRWDGYKVCEGYLCTLPIKGGAWPR